MPDSIARFIKESVVVTDGDLTIVAATDSVERLFNLDKPVVGRNWSKVALPFFPADSSPIHNPEFLLRSSNEHSGLTNIVVDGVKSHIFYTVSRENNVNGNAGYRIVIDDRPETVNLHDDLIRFRSALENAHETIVITDVDGTMLYANPAFEKTSGYAREEAIGSNPRLLKSGRHDHAFYESLWETITSGEVWTGEFINKRKDGSIYFDRASISPIKDEQGVITSFISVRQNVTEAKIAEENLKLSEQRNSAILDTVGEGVVVIGRDSRIRFVNKEVSNIFGYSEDELIGVDIKILMPEEYRAKHTTGMKRYVETEKPRILGKRVEMEGLRKDGSIFPLEIRIEETKTDSEFGGDSFFTGAMRDISKRAKAIQALRNQTRLLKELDDFKDKMFSFISHDLRSPLASNLGLVNLLLDSGKEPITDRQTKILKTLSKSILHQLKLVQDLIDISQAQRGVMEINPAPAKAGDIVKESVLMLKQMAKDKGIKIIENRGDDIWLNIDMEKMIQVVNNLLSNAIKFTEPGGKVTLDTTSDGDNVEIVVQDTGVGMDADNLAKVFDLSEKVSTFGTAGERGTGLGLSICEEITTLNKGSLVLESELGKGSKARLKFKRCKEPT